MWKLKKLWKMGNISFLPFEELINYNNEIISRSWSSILLFNSLKDETEDMFCTLPTQHLSLLLPALILIIQTIVIPIPTQIQIQVHVTWVFSWMHQLDVFLEVVNCCWDVKKGDKVICNLSFNNPHQRKYEAIVECCENKCGNKVEMGGFSNGWIDWLQLFGIQFIFSIKIIKKNVFPMEFVGEFELFSEEEWIYNLVLDVVNEIGIEKSWRWRWRECFK